MRISRILLSSIIFLFIFNLPVLAQSAEECILFGNNLYKRGEYDEAIKYYDAALKIEPGNISAICNKGNALYLQRKYEEAIFCFDKVLEQDPDNSHALLYRDYTLNLLSRSNNSSEKLLEDFLHMAIEKEEAGNYEEVIFYSNEVIELDPDNSEAWKLKGNALYIQERYDEALKCMRKYVELNPFVSEGWINKSKVLERQGRYSSAIEDLDVALTLEPGNYTALYLQALILKKLERYEESLKFCNKALNIHENSIESEKLKEELLIILSDS